MRAPVRNETRTNLQAAHSGIDRWERVSPYFISTLRERMDCFRGQLAVLVERMASTLIAMIDSSLSALVKALKIVAPSVNSGLGPQRLIVTLVQQLRIQAMHDQDIREGTVDLIESKFKLGQ